MKIIQIRGNNASGKTTTVRQYVNKNNFEIEEISVNGLKTHISTNKKKNIIVLGRYDKKTGGCDLFKNRTHVLNTIVYLEKNYKPEIIIFEGLIYSFTFKFASELAEYVKNHGGEYLGICLYTEPDVALERLYLRNGGKPVNEQLILNSTKRVVNSYNKLLSSGYNVKIIDTTHLKIENMCNILEKELYEG